MSAAFTYPGVYIQEVPSTVHTIVPAPTAVAAFIGRAVRGPINTPVRIHSYADFQRAFGDLWQNSEMPFAVQQYFLNGGSDAYIVRVMTQGIVSAQANAQTSITIPTATGALSIAAQNPGLWFLNVTVAVDLNTRKINGVRRADEFNLTMYYRAIDPVTGAVTSTVETFPNISYLATAQNYIATTLANDSNFIAVLGTVPQGAPVAGLYSLSGAQWMANANFTAGASIIDSNGNEQVVTTAGTSGTSQPNWSVIPGGTTADGTVVWTNQGPSRFAGWRPNTAYLAGQVIFDGTHIQQVTTAGTSGATAPTFAAAQGATTNDGTVVWTNEGSVVADGWRPNAAFVAGAQVVDPAGNLQVVTTAGTSGAAAPAWNATVGGTTNDNSVVWTNRGPRNASVWQPSTFFPAGARIYDSNGNLQQVTTAGVSGTMQPAWATTGTTNDGPVVWTFQNATNLSDGAPLLRADLTASTLEANKNGIYALKDAEIFTIMVLPPYAPQENGGTIDLDTTYSAIWADALAFCQAERAILLVDPPSPGVWIDERHAYQALTAATPAIDNVRDPNSATYYPWLEINDPLINNRQRNFAPSATVAGVIAKTDAKRGVWKSPAGEEAKMLGVSALEYLLNNAENGDLNPLGVNCLRTFPILGSVVWGARTLDGADAQASQWKYLAVRRMALFLETSLYRGTNWAVFEPNDQPLWSQLRLNIDSFMRNLFRQGAFQGATPKDAYFVKCDSDTTTQTDIDSGVVNILVGFAPLKPAEFVVIKISQITGDTNA